MFGAGVRELLERINMNNEQAGPCWLCSKTAIEVAQAEALAERISANVQLLAGKPPRTTPSTMKPPAKSMHAWSVTRP